jgi:hypothetical protein
MVIAGAEVEFVDVNWLVIFCSDVESGDVKKP